MQTRRSKFHELKESALGEGIVACSRRIVLICLISTSLLTVNSLGYAARIPEDLLLRLQQTVQQGHIQAARTQLQDAMKQFPSEPGLYNLLGTLEAQQGNLRAAESDFRKALALEPGFVGALLNLGHLYLERAAQDHSADTKALSAYREVLLHDKNNAEALYQAAALLLSRGDFLQSLGYLDRLPADLQARSQVLATRCADHVGLSQHAEAASEAEALLKSPDLVQDDVLSVLPQIERHDASFAVWMLEQLDSRKLAARDALGQLGLLYSRQDQLAQARDTLERAEQAGDPSAEMLSELARTAYRQRDWEGALGYLAHARELDPHNAGINFFFGVVCIELNLPEEARKSLTEAARLNPANAYYEYALGSVAMHGRDPAEAVHYFEKYVSSKPQDPRGRFALGVARFYNADYGAAIKDLHSVVQRTQTAPGAHYFLGRIARLQDDLPLAELEWNEAVKADPRFADALADLALLHIRSEKYNEAAAELERAAAVDSNNFRVNANLLILYQKLWDPRAEEQRKRFEEIKQKRDEDEQLLWRTIEVRP